MSQYYILRYSQGWNQHEVLVHHTDFQANGIARTGYVCELAINVNLTAIRVNKTIENVHEGRFTRAILAYQSMNLAFTHLEIDMIVGNTPGQVLVMLRISTAKGLDCSWVAASSVLSSIDNTPTAHAGEDEPRPYIIPNLARKVCRQRQVVWCDQQDLPEQSIPTRRVKFGADMADWDCCSNLPRC